MSEHDNARIELKIYKQWPDFELYDSHKVYYEDLHRLIKRAIEEERMACATLARKIIEGNSYPDTALEAEARILARGGVE